MSRLAKILALAGACAVPVMTAACGTEKIQVPKSAGAVYHGAVLFSQRCAGCHTLNAAGTHGSAPNIRTAQANSGPNFNVRCERPITRVLYAIENGGFSGAYMPQNIVVGPDAVDVAKFVATYAGRLAPKLTGAEICQSKQIGTLPTAGQSTATAAGSGSPQPNQLTTSSTTASTVTATATTAASATKARNRHKKSAHS